MYELASDINSFENINFRQTSIPLEVSIIIPVYNGEAFIARCLNSALNQTIGHDKYEIIVIDDCSSDHTVDIVKNYQKKHECIQLIRNNKNLRPGIARNSGIEYSRAKYIYFLDSDDYIRKDTLEILLNIANNEKCICLSNIYLEKENGDKFILNKKCNNLPIDFINMSFSFYVTSILMSRCLLTTIRHRKGLHEDIIFLCDLLSSNPCVKKTNEALYYYAYNKKSVMRTYDEKTAYDYVNAWYYVRKKLVTDEKYDKIWHSTLNRILDTIRKRLCQDSKKNTKTDIILYDILHDKDVLSGNRYQAEKREVTINISIIIVTFNAEKTIERTLQSILSQLYKNIEIVIIDGRSKDNTLQIIEKYSQYISVLVSEEDKGIYDAMNKGIHNTHNDYIMFMNAGDEFHDKYSLLRLAEAAQSTQSDIIAGQTYEYDSNKNFIQKRRNNIDYIMVLKGMPVCHQSIIYKKELHNSLGYYDTSYRISADYKFILDAWYSGKTFYEIDDIIAGFVRDGVSSTNNKLLREEAQKARKTYLSFLTDDDFKIFSMKWAEIPRDILNEMGKKYKGINKQFDLALEQLLVEQTSSKVVNPLCRGKHMVCSHNLAAILGNGPSLRGFNFQKDLKGYATFGMNAAYRYWDKINWYPDYYSCLDLVVGLSHKDEIKRLIDRSDEYGIRNFLLRDNLIKELGESGQNPKVVNFDELEHSGSPFFPPSPITTGSHTMAWAASMGYTDIILLGIDSNYVEVLKEAKNTAGHILEITKDIDHNPNYFFDDYQRKGDRYNIPNVHPEPDRATHLCSWRSLQPVLNELGVRVVNANPDSKVDAFPKVPFAHALEFLHAMVLPEPGLAAQPIIPAIAPSDKKIPSSTTGQRLGKRCSHLLTRLLGSRHVWGTVERLIEYVVETLHKISPLIRVVALAALILPLLGAFFLPSQWSVAFLFLLLGELVTGGALFAACYLRRVLNTREHRLLAAATANIQKNCQELNKKLTQECHSLSINLIDIQKEYNELNKKQKETELLTKTMRNILSHTIVYANMGEIPVFPRDLHVHIDESQIILDLFSRSSIMLDVGANRGGTALPFLRAGWEVWAFEPDPVNLQFLVKATADFPLCHIDGRAVSDTSGQSLPFYTSPESHGVSSLLPFLESHQQISTVETVTLRDFCASEHVDKIGLLKIDTEGFDLHVLKGFPFDVIQPDVILCEFEDNNTRQIGYTVSDLADFLIAQGYSLYVSEWHPVIRYGVQHDWCRLYPWGKTSVPPQAWGNILAFYDNPDKEFLLQAILRHITF